jgi:hypothetical protein
MEMIVKTRAAALALAVTAALMVSADPADAASGSADCSGKGTVAVSAKYQQASGLQVHVKQDGPPTAPTWGRQVDPGPNLYPVQWILRSPYAAGNWGASVVDNQYGGLDGAGAQCSERAAPTSNALETHALADKNCPAGQTVVINSGGWAQHWYFWRNSPSSSQQRILSAQPYSIDVDRFVDTGMNSIVNIRVEAHPGGSQAEDYINFWRTWCSGTLGAHAD